MTALAEVMQRVSEGVSHLAHLATLLDWRHCT